MHAAGLEYETKPIPDFADISVPIPFPIHVLGHRHLGSFLVVYNPIIEFLNPLSLSFLLMSQPVNGVS
jgi:hypothetical protein